MRFNCPTCKRSLEGTRADFPALPFCSARCRSADLGSWLNESYRIATPGSDDELDAGVPTGGTGTPPSENN
jgi:endogenous inhibitor of DNA gyrase (YacG/DUF329 family)